MNKNVNLILEKILPERRPKIEELSPTDILQLLTVAVRDAFPNDQTIPGITVATLNNDVVYASVVRYKGKYGKEKYIVAKYKSSSLLSTLKGLANKFADYWDSLPTIHEIKNDPQNTHTKELI